MRSVFLKNALIFLGLLAAFLPVSPAQGAPISIDITAEISRIDDSDAFLDGAIDVGDILHGTYIYETTTADTNASSEVGDYRHTTAPFGITLEVNGYLFRTDPDNVDFLVELCNDHHNNHDAYLLRSYKNLFDISVPLGDPIFSWSRDNHIHWQLDDFLTHTALASTAGTALPTMPPVLSDWPHNSLTISSQQYFGGSQYFFISADVTSAVLSPTSAPEPTTMILLGLGLVSLAGVRRKMLRSLLLDHRHGVVEYLDTRLGGGD